MPVRTVNELPVSILDLATISEGTTPGAALRSTLDLAERADQWGYHRYWVAEHHNMAPIASAATSVLIGLIAERTRKLRVGSGGIMLPNHSPLIIAEQFGTLESLYPGRIDLGLGRAPGTDGRTAQALRRSASDDFPGMVDELRSYFTPERTGQRPQVQAIPAVGQDPLVWLLGSSDFSAGLAAQLGLPFSFAGHFSPGFTFPAIDTYRKNFQPSEVLSEPYVKLGLNLSVAETDGEARLQFSSTEQHFLALGRGRPVEIQPPREMTQQEVRAVHSSVSGAVVGSPATVKEQLGSLLDTAEIDEVMFTSYIYEHEDRLRSYELLKEVVDGA
ncbi:LLM class flavin-dependent oxidoreductase [Nesterenkonia populi]